MASEDSELIVAEILLQLARLVHDSEMKRTLPFSWGSKKQRTRPCFSPNRILGCKKRKICFSSVTSESSRKKKKVASRNKGFLLPDLNLPLPNKEEEEELRNCLSTCGWEWRLVCFCQTLFWYSYTTWNNVSYMGLKVRILSWVFLWIILLAIFCFFGKL